MNSSCEAASVEAMVQYLATNLIRHGYYFYFSSRVPLHKEPSRVDVKLVDRYGANLDKFTRARRKRNGLANVAYVRHGRDFVLLATEGEHVIFEEHPLHDLRHRPIRMHGYSVGAGRGPDGRYHASVRISDEAFAEIRDYFLELATHRSPDHLTVELRQIRFVPYARVRRQLLKLLRLINDARRRAGFEEVPSSALQLRRGITKVFVNGGNKLTDEV